MLGYNKKYPSIFDLESRARGRIPRFALDYLRGGIGCEVGLQQNRQALDAVKLVPRYLRDISNCDISTSLFGERYAMPIGISPVGLAGMIWPGAESMLAREAQQAQIPFVLSMVGTTALETIAEQTQGKAWFQLYPTADWEITEDLIKRAGTCGYRVLVVTVDTPVRAKRERELRNDLTLPLKLTPRNLFYSALCPVWATAQLRQGLPRFESLSRYAPTDKKSLGGVATFVSELTANGVTKEHLHRIRELWDGKLVVKGLLHAEDAISACDLGADGIIVSNHGGRQMDAAPASIEVLATFVEAVGERCAVMLDSGIRSGTDVLRAMATGAAFVFSGRSFYYGAAALGERGGRQAIEIFRDEITRGLAQLGCSQMSKLDGNWIR
jgi:isopentenyl diphosphate isomerase/L-lactate dehydrogenase-like FMN-dependent dehydrogenase